jgi:hypothetical protein
MTTAMMKAKTAAMMPQSIQVRFNGLLLAPAGRAQRSEFYPGRGRIARQAPDGVKPPLFQFSKRGRRRFLGPGKTVKVEV